MIEIVAGVAAAAVLAVSQVIDDHRRPETLDEVVDQEMDRIRRQRERAYADKPEAPK